jgi:predicted dienelactone hydrolase
VPPTTEPAETTTTVAPGPVDFTVEGEFAVGVRTISLGDRNMDVWYPVDPASVEGSQTEIFDQLSVFPEALQPLIPAELQGEIDTGTYRDAPVLAADGPFRVVVYSHGFGGYRQVSTNFTRHLATWGYVAISIDHLERGIAAQATGTLGGAPNQDVVDVTNGLAALAADAELGGVVNVDDVIITGHSAGAGTSARAANELDAISAFVSITGGVPTTTEAGDTGIRGVSGTLPNGTYEFTIDAVSDTELTITADGVTTQVPVDDLTFGAFGTTLTLFAVAAADPAAGPVFQPGTISFTVAAPAKPGLVIASELDEVVPPSRSLALYGAMTGPRWLAVIAKAGHNSFTDSCVGIRELGGLDALVALIGEAQVKRANDGCTDEYADPIASQAVLNQYVVAFVRTQFGEPVDPAALSETAIAGIDGISLTTFESS